MTSAPLHHDAAPPPPAGAPCLPDIPALVITARQAVILTTDGEIKTLPHQQARREIGSGPVLVCHAPYTRARLGQERLACFDVLELFAFVHPARFCVPTPAGLAKALGLSVPGDAEDYPFTLAEAATALLMDLRAELQNRPEGAKSADPLEIVRAMGRQGEGWNWTPFVLSAAGQTYQPEMPVFTKVAMNIWRALPEWAEGAPPPPPSHYPVTEQESQERLAQILATGGNQATPRAQQQDYAARIIAAFDPPAAEDQPHVVLAEAGTGTGKTLGYLAPASVWAEKNGAPVWVSTYTKNLQRQISQELSRLYPDPALKDKKVAVRKGRENYLCLLNLEDAVIGAALAKDPAQAIAAGIMARWAAASKDGDLQGGDFPGWLPGLLGIAHTLGLSDKRGECIYAACEHYHKCFVEKAVRKARHADIVVANHALVMIQTALAAPGEALPQRYIFDEGHHLFEAADSAFAGHLTARETADLRRWILGHESGDRKSRARGLKRRLEDLAAGDDTAEKALEDILHQARHLSADGWSRRLKDSQPQGAAESFLHMIYRQVMARAPGRDGPYSLETHTNPLIDGLAEQAETLAGHLRALQKPMRALSARLKKRLSDEAATLDSDTRRRIEAAAAGLDRRTEAMVGAWVAMLETLQNKKAQAQADSFIDWMEIERIEGRAWDLGLYRHWINPMQPFAAALRPAAHGIVVTSATLRDGTSDEQQDWQAAQLRTGADGLSAAPHLFSVNSPFDYAAQTAIIVVNDVNKNDLAQVAAAYRALFMAAGGGGLGLFTAIQRLRAVHSHIAGPLEEQNIRLYAQHIDGMDTGTLVDIFREDIHACLLGTDAVRDGVDVPGDSLRLLIYDRVPWPRPNILHKARRDAFGGRAYDEMITRLKLRQAYGRLIRRDGDKGVFVMLDPGLPSRLHGAFPEGAAVRKLGLAEAVALIKEQNTAQE